MIIIPDMFGSFGDPKIDRFSIDTAGVNDAIYHKNGGCDGLDSAMRTGETKSRLPGQLPASRSTLPGQYGVRPHIEPRTAIVAYAFVSIFLLGYFHSGEGAPLVSDPSGPASGWQCIEHDPAGIYLISAEDASRESALNSCLASTAEWAMVLDPQWNVMRVYNANQTASVRISWDPSTVNADGTPLMDIALYRVYWGASGNPSELSVDVPAGTTTTVIDNLLADSVYLFHVTAVDSAGNESEPSGLAVKYMAGM